MNDSVEKGRSQNGSCVNYTRSGILSRTFACKLELNKKNIQSDNSTISTGDLGVQQNNGEFGGSVGFKCSDGYWLWKCPVWPIIENCEQLFAKFPETGKTIS